MTCEDFNIYDAKLTDKIAAIALAGAIAAIGEAGLDKVKRAFIGVGPTPSEDCCEALVVWVSNIRPYDSNTPDTLVENRILVHFGISFDVNVRIGDCYWEIMGEGNAAQPAPAKEITKMAVRINQYSYAVYLGVLKALTDIGCSVSVSPRPGDPFQGGGCAGMNASFSVSVI